MADITVTIDAEHIDLLRRRIASECGTAAERLHGVADAYSMGIYAFGKSEVDLSKLHAALEEAQVWGRLLDELGWEPNGADGQPYTLTAPRERLRDLFGSSLSTLAESFDEVEASPWRALRPSEVAQLKVEQIEFFEDLLDRVGWPEADHEEGGG